MDNAVLEQFKFSVIESQLPHSSSGCVSRVQTVSGDFISITPFVKMCRSETQVDVTPHLQPPAAKPGIRLSTPSHRVKYLRAK